MSIWTEEQAMRRALALAERGRGSVEPNPVVGCVLLRDGRLIGEGWHQRFGGPHAEVEAIADARRRSEDTRHATAVVTLEPCCHTGKTGPCTDALISAGVSRVVCAMVDPFDKVAGKGTQRLADAGVTVEVGLCEREARRVNGPFIKGVTRQLPWVICKWAQTIDGKTATATGDSQWISNALSREKVHELRGRVDAIAVGVGTVIADDPSLTARPSDAMKVKRVARRVVFDRSGRMPQLPGSKLLHDGGPAVLVWRDSLEAGLRHLFTEGCSNVLFEGGATLHGALLEQGLADELWVFVAPRVLGDAEALDAMVGRSVIQMKDTLNFELASVEVLDGDVWLRYLAISK